MSSGSDVGLGRSSDRDGEYRGLDRASSERASEYHLSWNNYSASLASFLRILSTAKQGEEDLSDVTISCAGGRQFPAHRLVLATCSSYFRQLFVGRSVGCSQGCHTHPIVYIPDLTELVMEHLLAFMYQGETTVPTHLLLPLIEAAKLLGIQGLTEPPNIEGLTEPPPGPHKVEEKLKENNLGLFCPSASRAVTKQEPDSESLLTNGSQTCYRADQVTQIKPEPAKESQHQQEMAKPDSSVSLVFPPRPSSSSSGSVFQRLHSLASPLALGLASGHLGLGLDLSQHLGPVLAGQPQQRRKSSPPAAQGVLGSGLASPNCSIGSSTQVNSSSCGPGPLGYQAHYPPTEDPTRPFACTQCPKRFRMKHHLKEHTLIHSGEMPFSCHLCPKRFNRSYTLKNHMKLHSAGSLPDKFQQDGDPSSSEMIVPLLSQPPSFH